MGRHVREFALAAVILGASVAPAMAQGVATQTAGRPAARDAQESPVIVVLAYNYAGVPIDTLARAREKAMRIYQDAGVEIWREPLAARSTQDGTAADLDHSAADSHQVFTVRMLIRPRRPVASAALWSSESVMGVALQSGESGGTVSLYFDEVLRAAGRYKQASSEVLGLVIAHEIGHLLLPYPAHSSTGVMRPEWRSADFQQAGLEAFGFSASEAAAIRQRVAGRHEIAGIANPAR
jgi:hypothetical protein